jgi:hypothetical protein
MSMSAPTAVPNRNESRRLFGATAGTLFAVILTWTRPAPLGVTDTPTFGLGAHDPGVSEGTGVAVRVGVAAGVLVASGMSVG